MSLSPIPIPIAAVDQFVEDHSYPGGRRFFRKLVFVSEDGSMRDVYFKDDRVTVFYSGVLYDWYGNVVDMSRAIRHVVKYYGGSNCRNDAHEQFIVEKINGKLAIARIRYEHDEICRSLIPPHKNTLTGNMLGGYPFLEEDKNHEFDRMNDTVVVRSPVFGAFVMSSGRNNLGRPAVFYNVRDITSGETIPAVIRVPGDNELPENWKTLTCLKKPWEYFCFSTATRDEVFAMPRGTEPPFYCANCLGGEIILSRDGQKMFSYTPEGMGLARRRIATDVNVIKHIKQPHLFWYYDD